MYFVYTHKTKVLMQGKLFKKCTHFLYCSVLSLGGKVITRRMLQPDMESIFTKIIFEIFRSKETIMWIIKIKCFVPPRILVIKRTLMHLFLFTNSAQRELLSICTLQSIHTAINFPRISTLHKTCFSERCS